VTGERRKRLFAVLVVLSSVSFALLAHAALIDRLPPVWGALLSLVPLFALLLWAVRRSGGRVAAVALVALAAVALWLGWDSLQRHFPSIFFLEHAGANLLLALLFGRTLLAGREPLVTRFARLLHGSLPPEVQRYTRHVTLAWTIFFASLFTLSATLYLGGFVAAWSFLANIASPFLIGAMFVIEYAVRLRALPDWERVGILGGIRAFSRHFGGAHAESTR
jgi:uncharacterized membrane protein